MDLFKRPQPLAETAIPLQYVAIVDTEASNLPEVEWAQIRIADSLSQLVSEVSDAVVIWAVRDDEQSLAKVRLVSENPAVCGVQIARVVGLTSYAPSLASEQAFWNCPVIQFEDWVAEAQEAAREAELARRATLDRDEIKKSDAMRADGTFKKQVVTEIPDDGDLELVL